MPNKVMQPTIRKFSPPPIAGNLLLISAWFWLFVPLFPYLEIIFTEEDFRTSQIVSLAIVALLVRQWRMGKLPIHLNQPAQLRLAPLGVMLFGAVGFLLNEWQLDVNTLSSTLFALGSYGLLGLWMAPRRWRHGLPAALLLVGMLPYGHHMQTFIGYPMRIATAALVRDVLAGAGVTAVGIDTILVLENGVSHIDLPCSGVQSLWTGGLFLLAATWLEERRIGLRWLGVLLILGVLLFVANFVRVLALVVAGSVAGLPLLAEMLHVPLGVLGFVLACAVALWGVRQLKPLTSVQAAHSRQRDAEENSSANADAGTSVAQKGWLSYFVSNKLAIVLACLLFAGSFFYTERAQTGLQAESTPFVFPFETEPEPLTKWERDWLTRDGAESAERHTFTYNDINGSMILVTSQTWRAHHKPERCFEVYGLPLGEAQTMLVRPDFPLKVLDLDDGRYTATYWFQSAETTTDDYATRIWADIAPQRERWVLVSMVFEGDLESAEIAPFYEMLHKTVANQLDTAVASR